MQTQWLCCFINFYHTNLFWLVVSDSLFENVNGAINVFLVGVHGYQGWNLRRKKIKSNDSFKAAVHQCRRWKCDQRGAQRTDRREVPVKHSFQTYHPRFVLELFDGPQDITGFCYVTWGKTEALYFLLTNKCKVLTVKMSNYKSHEYKDVCFFFSQESTFEELKYDSI